MIQLWSEVLITPLPAAHTRSYNEAIGCSDCVVLEWDQTNFMTHLSLSTSPCPRRAVMIPFRASTAFGCIDVGKEESSSRRREGSRVETFSRGDVATVECESREEASRRIRCLHVHVLRLVPLAGKMGIPLHPTYPLLGSRFLGFCREAPDARSRGMGTASSNSRRVVSQPDLRVSTAVHLNEGTLIVIGMFRARRTISCSVLWRLNEGLRGINETMR
ncbi:hypothetical protein PM082_018250 [Marasmius tenuissimus]|nr:hypothetical protein PM082_018250 [Marasmius tenuissimus]